MLLFRIINVLHYSQEDYASHKVTTLRPRRKIITTVELLKQFLGILFEYEINVFPDHKNLFYAATLSKSQRVMCWRFIIEEFGTNIQHMSGVENIVADMLSRFSCTSIYEY